MSIYVVFRCSAEKCDIGTLEAQPSDSIDAIAIQQKYRAKEGYALNSENVKDGVQLLCPRCSSPVAIRADAVDFYFVPGAVRIGETESDNGVS